MTHIDTKKKQPDARALDRRTFLQLGACLGTGAALAAISPSSEIAAIKLSFGAARVRRGGAVRLTLEGLSSVVRKARVHLIEVETGALLASVDARRQPDGALGLDYLARVDARGREAVEIVAVVACEDDQFVQSEVLEVVCTPLLPGV